VGFCWLDLNHDRPSIMSLIDTLESHDTFYKMFIDMIPYDVYPLTPDEKKTLSEKRKNDKYGSNKVLFFFP
jgi:hypothetical protein